MLRQASSLTSATSLSAILNLHERIENKLFLDRTRKDSNFKRPHICATLFQIEKCCIFVQLVEAAKVEMSLIESFAGDYRRWSRIERIVSPAFLIAALGGVASMFTPLLGG
jgi:hypothetical protein